MSTDQNGSQTPNDASRDTDTTHAEASEESPDNGSSAEESEQNEEDVLREEIESLKAERDELNDRLLRKAAEYENYRRRMDREKERRHTSGKLAVLEPMLEVVDDFERSLEAARDLEDSDDVESAYQSLKGGVEMVFQKLKDELHSLGVEPIEAEGEPFDEHLHEAMMRQPTDEAEPGTVLHEVRKGYKMGDRVIRHSRVVVAAPPEENDPSDAESSEESNA